MSVSVVIPARNAAALLPRVLGPLAGQDVVVVDDGSTDATAAVAREHGARVVAGEGKGPAAARNLGAAATAGEVLAFLDSDCFPAPGWAEAGAAALDGGLDLVQGRVDPDPEAALGPFDRSLFVRRAHGLFESANLFVTRGLFDELGGFEGWLGPREGKELAEDVWFGWRAVRAGARTGFTEAALVHHAVFPRGPGGFVAERARLRFFPAMAARMPELREAFFYRRYFHSRRSAAFDLALAGLAARRPLLALPYAALVAHDAHSWGKRRAPAVAAAGVAADAVGAAALALGSVRARSPLF